MPVDYSKWDALELSDDSDIEVHPNVDKRSFIRAKQAQIHQERDHRKHRIETLKYERIINDRLLTRIEAFLSALKSHRGESEQRGGQNEAVDQTVLQAVIESAGDLADDQPPPRPPGVHTKEGEAPSYSKMMASLVDQVKKDVDAQMPSDRFESFISEVGKHKAKVLDLQQQLLEELSELEKKEKAKITSESIHTGFSTSYIAKPRPSEPPASEQTASVELLNPGPRNGSRHTQRAPSAESGAEADVEDGGEETDDLHAQRESSVNRPTKLGVQFSLIDTSDYRASMEFISKHPSVLSEREENGLLLEAFDAQLEGHEKRARSCVHQALLLQYCRNLGRDGVGLFYKRMTTKDHQARKMFADDVNKTYARLRERAAVMKEEGPEDDDGGPGVEQIQLHAVNPGQQINISVPNPHDPSQAEACKVFDTFPLILRQALETGSLDEVNKVLGKMSVEEAEEVVGKLGEGGMLSLEEGIVDATTDEGREKMKYIEREGRMPEAERVIEMSEETDAEEQIYEKGGYAEDDEAPQASSSVDVTGAAGEKRYRAPLSEISEGTLVRLAVDEVD